MPEDETKAFPIVPFTSTLPVLQAVVNAGVKCKAVGEYKASATWDKSEHATPVLKNLQADD